MQSSLRLLGDAGSQWMKHNAPRLGAALAYYAVLSLAPMLILAVAVCGFFFGEAVVRGEVYWQVSQAVGTQSAAVIQSLLTGIHQPAGVNVAALLVLLFGASGVFVELRDALNYIWDVPQKSGSGLLLFLHDRFFSFAMVIVSGFLLALSLIASELFHVFSNRTELHFSAAVLANVNFLLAFLAKAFLFALIYKVVPELRIQWKDVVIGATLTAALFEIGAWLISIYLGKAGIGSAYGAAGSLVALLVWIYYSAQVFLYGAELTHVYAQSRRRKLISNPNR
jgi:membrane protein